MAKTKRGKESRWLNLHRIKMKKKPTKEESIFCEALKSIGIKFRHQSQCYTKEFQCIVDFFIKSDGLKIAIEIDGDYHFSKAQMDKDAYRTQWLKENRGYDMVRFTNDEVNKNVLGCLQKLADYYTSKVQKSESNNFKNFVKIITLPIKQPSYA